MPQIDDEVERAFREADATDDEAVHLAFKERLLTSHDEASLLRHFAFLGRAQNPDLRQRLARFFVWHGTMAVDFLAQAAGTEEHPRERATALQILGMIGQRHRDAKARALEAVLRALDDPSEAVRELAVMALGWVGSSKHVPRLVALLDAPEPPAVRAMAATQLTLLAGSSERNRTRALDAIARALEAEATLPETVRSALADAARRLHKK